MAMYKVIHNGKSVFLGPLTTCWDHICSKVPLDSTIESIYKDGWRVKPARKPGLERALEELRTAT